MSPADESPDPATLLAELRSAALSEWTRPYTEEAQNAPLAPVGAGEVAEEGSPLPSEALPGAAP